MFDGDTTGMGTPSTPLTVTGCELQVVDITNGMIMSNDSNYFDPTTLTPKVPVYEFRKDGTILQRNGAQDVIPANPDLYDLNIPIANDFVAPTTRADIVLRQIGDPSKRCFMDVDINTGRVRFRVAETIQPGASGTTSG